MGFKSYVEGNVICREEGASLPLPTNAKELESGYTNGINTDGALVRLALSTSDIVNTTKQLLSVEKKVEACHSLKTMKNSNPSEQDLQV